MNIRLIGVGLLASLALGACGRGGDRVVEKDTRTVVHDQPIVVREQDHADRDHRDNHMDQAPGGPDRHVDHMNPPAGPDRRDDHH